MIKIYRCVRPSKTAMLKLHLIEKIYIQINRKNGKDVKDNSQKFY